MTLRCKCGGRVRVQGGTDPGAASDGFFEHYECQACGRTGGYRHDPHTEDELTGCLTRSDRRGEVFAGR